MTAQLARTGKSVSITMDIWYDPNTKEVHITSNDLKEFGGLHFNPPHGKHLDQRARALLNAHGISTDDEG